MTTAAKLSVANQALQMIGAKPITDFDDGSAEADAVNLIYDDTRDEFLVASPWTFARFRALMTEITYSSETPSAWITLTSYAVADRVLSGGKNYVCLTAHTSGTFATDLAAGKWILAATDLPVTSDNIAVVYALPTDFLKLYMISTAAVHQVEFTDLQGTKTKVLLSDTSTLGIIYIFQNDDPSTYYPKAKKAFIKRLAAELCLYLSSSQTTRTSLITEYEKMDLPMAESEDSQQGTQLAPDHYEWERSRLVGSGSIFPTSPGAQVWVPVWSF